MGDDEYSDTFITVIIVCLICLFLINIGVNIFACIGG